MSLVVAGFSYASIGSDRRLAWEYLRRNKAYQSDWLDLQALVQRTGQRTFSGDREQLSVAQHLSTSVADQWGLLAFVDPNIDSRQAAVFWTVQACPSIILASIIEPQALHRYGATEINLDQLHPTTCTTEDGAEHLIFKDRITDYQLILPHHSMDLSHAYVAFHLPLDANETLQFKAIHEFRQFLVHAAAPPDGEDIAIADIEIADAEASVRQKVRQLQIYDLRMASVKYHTIAELIFGVHRVRERWPEGHLKSQIHYATKAAEKMVNGGYKELLRH